MSFFDWLQSLWHRRKPPAPSPPTGDTGSVLAAVNAARAHVRLPPLVGSTDLDAVAGGHATAMESAGALAHENIGDLTPARRLTTAGIHWVAEGEVIAQGPATASACVDLWLRSPPHRAILLGNYLRLGVGQAGTYWCADLVR